MAKVIIPTPPAGVYRFLLRRQFDRVFFRILYRWNIRAGAWYLDIANDLNVAQARGVKLNLGKDKFQPYRYKDVPQGQFDIVDSTNTHTEPTLDTFGGIVEVQYTEVET